MSATTHGDAVVSSIDPFSDEFFADLYGVHDRLRDAGPVVWLEKYGVWGMARYAEVHAALNDWQTFISGAGAGIHDLRRRKAWRPPSILLEADPPLHDVTRGAMGRVLSGPAIRRLRASFQTQAERLVEELFSRGEFDAVKDLAVAYPLKVVGDAVGIPPEGRECLLPFGNMLFNSFGPENEVFRQSIIESERVVPALFAQCDRGALTPDGFGMQFYRAADEGRFPAEYAPVLVRSILSAGFDTTVCGLSNAIYGFATNPEQWQILRENPALIRTAFDEIIRWESPVQTFFRTTSKEVEIAGVRLAPDQKVLLFLAAANRDPRRWEKADALDVCRHAAGHVAFGSGIHVCIGQMIARLEAELLFAALARCVVTFELAGRPVRRASNTLRGFATLPVRVRRI